jgi:hypothetical protein
VVVFAASVLIMIGLLIAKAAARPAIAEGGSFARWSLALLCFAAIVFVAAILGYGPLPPSFALGVLAFLPVIACRSIGARIAWAVLATLLAWAALTLAQAPGPHDLAMATIQTVGAFGVGASQVVLGLAGLARAVTR